MVSLALGVRRDAVVGLIALLVYGAIFLATTFNHDATVAWSRSHGALDVAQGTPALQAIWQPRVAGCLLFSGFVATMA